MLSICCAFVGYMLSIHAKYMVHMVSRMLIMYYSPSWKPDNQAYYIQILTRLRAAAHRSRPELWLSTWVPCCDYDTAHWWPLPSSLWETNSTVGLHTIPLSIFAFQWLWFLATKLQSTLSIQRFQDIEDIQKNVTAGLKVTWKERFYKCFHHWHHHWIKHLDAEGDSFQGNVQLSAMKSFWVLKCTNLTSLYNHYFVNSKCCKVKFPDCVAPNGITHTTNFSEDQSI